MNVLLLGPQGSGKGTQAKRIAANHGVQHVSTGDILRAAIGAGTPLGRRVEPILASGGLVPDDLMIELIRECVSATDGFVLDGFPRTLPQAEALDAMLAQIGKQLDVVLLLQVTDEVATKRMLERAADESRPDDAPEAISRRLALYHEMTEPVVEHYRGDGALVEVPAEKSIPEVEAEIEHALGDVRAGAST